MKITLLQDPRGINLSMRRRQKKDPFLRGPGSGNLGAQKETIHHLLCWWGRQSTIPHSLSLSHSLSSSLSLFLSLHLFLSRPPSCLPHVLDHSGSFGWSAGEVLSVSTRMSKRKSTENTKRMMTRTSMRVPHQKYVSYVSCVLCVWT